MGIFEKLIRKHDSVETPVQQFTYEIAPRYRGFKKFHITVFGDKESEKNNELLRDINLNGSLIAFECRNMKDTNQPYLLVLLNGKKIGSIFDADRISDVCEGRIEAVHLHYDTENIVMQNGIIARSKPMMFVKYQSGQ